MLTVCSGAIWLGHSNTVVTPMEKSFSESSELPWKTANNVPYRQVIGSLMWLKIGSRPDLAYGIGKLSRDSESPIEYHSSAVKRVLRIVNGTRSYGILCNGSNPIEVEGYSDSEWAGCRNSRKSTSGYVFAV